MMQSFLNGQNVAQTSSNDDAASQAALPVELLEHIIRFLPAFENLQLREVSNLFCSIWETVVKEQLSITTPAIRGLTPDEGYAVLHEKQQAEISYLTGNKSKILAKNNNDKRINKIFEGLELLENNNNVAAYHAKEKLLNSLNEIIIRRKIPTAPRRNFIKVLSLKHSNLTRFPDKIFSDTTLDTFWTNLQRLYLNYNQLTTLPNAIGKCVALWILDVSDNKLTTLPDAFGCIKLCRLHVANNELIALPESIEQCSAHLFLSITGNNLKQLPVNLPGNIEFYDEDFGRIDKARCLELQKPALVENEDTQERPTKRRRIGNSQNATQTASTATAQSQAAPAPHQLALSTLPEELLCHIFMFLLDFENLRLREVSKLFYAIWETIAKEQLSITIPAIRGLTPEQAQKYLHEKQQAEISYLTENKSKTLAKNNNDKRINKIFERLKLLKKNANVATCHAKENLLNSLNEIIIRNGIAKAQQDNLGERLYLGHSNLTRFPDEIFSDTMLDTFWTNLQKLHLNNNQLTTLPDAIGKCAALKWLYVDNNKLSTLPDTIEQCVALLNLNVNYNKLTTLPDAIGKCVKLRILNAIYNKLITLPAAIGKCVALVALYVNNNELATLPDTIGQCVALKWLYVNNNELATLPAAIEQCISLEQLRITNNKLKQLPANLPGNIEFCDENNVNIGNARSLELQKPDLSENEETQDTQERPPKRQRR